ncbi:MAG: HlyD family efflux transporter periplasmic adaptor subunit [Planctomycetota bacterium]
MSPVRGSLEITVNDDGETRIRDKYILSTTVTGKMLRLDLDAGDEVHAGETELANIQPSDPTLLDPRTQAEAEARLRVAEAAFDQARSKVSRAREVMLLAERDAERATKLLSESAISMEDYDSAKHRSRMAIADVGSAESAQRVAKYEVEQAAAALTFLDAGNAERQDRTFQIVSPIEGKVLRILREDSGFVSAGTELLQIGDPRDLEIEIDVLSTDAVKITPGDTVRIVHWGGDQPLLARVQRVEPAAFLKVSALGVEEKRVNVIADFVDPWECRQTLGDGYRIEAEIVVDATTDESLKVASGTLFRDREQWHAYRVVDGVARRIPVTPGRSNGRETEILEGVSEGDELIVHPPESVHDGTAVTPIEGE